MPTKKSALPRWQLSDLYRDTTDPKIEEDIATTRQKAMLFEQQYRGKLSASREASGIKIAIANYEEIVERLTKLADYAYMVFAADATQGGFRQKIQAAVQKILNEVLFFELELTQLETSFLEKLIDDPKLRNYRHYLERQMQSKPHRLGEKEERILADKALTGRDAFVRLFQQEFARKQFSSRHGQRSELVSQSHILNQLYAPARNERKQASDALTKGLKEELDRVTFIYNTIIADKQNTDEYRAFTSPEAVRHMENQIDQNMVDAMIEAITGEYSTVATYYRWKKKILGLSTLQDYDRYAPIGRATTRFSFDQARTLILAAFREFSPEYAARAQEFFDRNWIDAPEAPGKQGGAFCIYITPDKHPYVFVNFHGTIHDVLVLAHELGHGVHASLAREQTHLNFDWPLTLAETASVFGEMLVFDYLKKQLTKKEDKLALYAAVIEGMFATVFRQVSMFLFERDVYSAYQQQGELPAETINKLWRTRQQEMFGSSVKLRSEYDIWWSYIPHFFHTPFYVYAYAFGELLTLALYDEYQKRGSAMTKQYLDLLRAGGSKSPQELLQSLGIDLHAPNFWQEGLGEIRRLVEEVKELA